MACQVEEIADCGDIYSVSRNLFILDREDKTWLSRSAVSLTSCGSLLALGYKTRMCLLTSQWISSTKTNTFILKWSGEVPTDISAILALPICPSEGSSSQKGADWFCVMVGYTNGSVGFYTNDGHLLLMEKFDDKPVLKISCHTGTYGTLPDDVYILYPSSECIVAGSALFKTLRRAKSQLARVQAGILAVSKVDSRPINVEKWYFTEQDHVKDAAVAGLQIKNTYDHLLAVSVYGGYDTRYRSIPPQSTLILAAGAKPYLGFHYAMEGAAAPQLHDVAIAVANKIKSALPSWFGGKSSDSTPKTTPNVRSEDLSMRSGIHDTQRHGCRTALSPDKRLVAVSDNVGRVAVVDVNKGIIIRLFKGYRDAQCAFVQIFELDNKKPRLDTIKEVRRAIFLIIYNPKKGLIDIRLMNRGNRVAVFTATKNGTLLYNTCGMVGVKKNYTSRKLNVADYQCVLLDPDGTLKQFNIPFHFALEGDVSLRSKDLHMLRELRDYIKKSTVRDEEFRANILNTAKELSTTDLKKHLLEMLIRNYDVSPSIVMACLEVLWDSFQDKDSETETLTKRDEKCTKYFVNLATITLFYRYLNGEDIDDMNGLINKMAICDADDSQESSDKKDNIKSDKLKLMESDSLILQRLLTLADDKRYRKHEKERVKFASKAAGNYKLFVCCFELDNDNDDDNDNNSEKSIGNQSNSKSSFIVLKSDINEDKMNAMAAHTFKLLFSLDDITTLGYYIKQCKINPMELIRIIILHIMNMSLDDIKMEQIQQLIEVIYYVSKVSDEATSLRYDEISDWWEAVRDLLVDTPCPLRSMIVAMTCRVVLQLFEFDSTSEEDWVSVSQENARWSILIGKLEDISILSIILYFNIPFQIKTLSKIPLSDLNINLRYIYSKGIGCVTELISKWLCSMGVLPEAIIANELQDKLPSANPDQDDDSDYVFFENHKVYLVENKVLFYWFSLLRKQFPHSTSADNIIANMGWEYAVAWQKDSNTTELLKSLTHCLINIKDTRLGLGLCIMIWTTYIGRPFEVVCRLLNKSGKVPMDRPSCLQEIGLSEHALLKFLERTAEYMGHFNNRASLPMDAKMSVFLYEDIWNRSTPCLVEVAQMTNIFNKDILSLYYQFSLSLLLQNQLEIKQSKHLNTLYDVDLDYAFESITVAETDFRKYNALASENKLKSVRMKFLNKVIMASLELILLEVDENPTALTNRKFNNRECQNIIDKVHILGSLWNVENDFLIRQKTIGLLKLGYDELVREGQVGEPQLILPAVVAVGMQRLKQHLLKCSRPTEWLSALPTTLVQHVERLEVDPSCARASIKSTERIVRNVLVAVLNGDKAPVDAANIRLADMIVKGCETIKQDKL